MAAEFALDNRHIIKISFDSISRAALYNKFVSHRGPQVAQARSILLYYKKIATCGPRCNRNLF